MPDHLDKLVASGVITIERSSNGTTLVRLTESAWETINQIALGSAHSPPAPSVPAANQHNRSNKRERY